MPVPLLASLAPGVPAEPHLKTFDEWRQSSGFAGVVERVRELLKRRATFQGIRRRTGYSPDTIRAAIARIREEERPVGGPWPLPRTPRQGSNERGAMTRGGDRA
jgi:hypothetical protein